MSAAASGDAVLKPQTASEARAWLDRFVAEFGGCAAVAKQLGVTRRYLDCVRAGTRLPGLDLAVQLEDLVGIPPRAWLPRVGDLIELINERGNR